MSQRKISFLMKIVLFAYSLLIECIYGLMSLFSWLMPSFKEHILGRQFSRELLHSLAKKRRQRKKGVVFYCSSAGEFEQAKPLIERLKQNKDIDLTIFFFSESGMRFARKRSESISFLKTPPDTLWHWRQIFKALKPDVIVVVRHELWPAFLAVGSEQCPIYVINASESPNSRQSKISLTSKSFLFKFPTKIKVVSFKDAQYFASSLGVDKARIEVTGDTKFDRVVERARAAQAEADDLKTRWDQLFGNRKRLIIGSAWHEDVLVVLKAYQELWREGVVGDWQVVIAPHDISPRVVRWMDRQCSEFDFPSLRSSELGVTLSSHLTNLPVVIVDQMGILAELYSLCDLAFVGGAMHHKIHNVLEPASRGLYITHGPLYKNSHEASQFVERGLVEPVQNHTELAEWWRRHLTSALPNNAILDFVSESCGASDNIYRSLMKTLTERR